MGQEQRVHAEFAHTAPDPGHPLVAPLAGALAEALHQTGAPAAMVAPCPADDSAAGDEASAASRAW